MDERAALLRAIREQPADDTVRLVYADWLDEHGEHDRAALIRSQINGGAVPVSLPLDESAQFVLGCGPSGATYLEDRIAFVCGSKSIVYVRGMVWSISVMCEDFVSAGFAERVFRENPIADVQLRNKWPGESNIWCESDTPWIIADPRHYYWIPSVLFWRLEGGDLTEGDGITSNSIEYTNRTLADRALSRACVAYGRSLVGLAPLPHGS